MKLSILKQYSDVKQNYLLSVSLCMTESLRCSKITRLLRYFVQQNFFSTCFMAVRWIHTSREYNEACKVSKMQLDEQLHRAVWK